VRPGQFVQFVEAGDVRIIGREDWLLSQQFRDRHDWAGAKWTNGVDDEIVRIAREDSSKPPSQQRVMVAPPERGLHWAQQYIEEKPRLVRAIERAVRQRDAADNFPVGVLEEALRNGTTPEDIAVRILRGSKNHGDAIAQSQADAPFLLAPRDSQFVRWLAKVDDQESADQNVRLTERAGSEPNYADLTTQLFDLLRALEIAGDVTDIGRFVGSEGHVQLARWYGRLCAQAREELPEEIENKLLNELTYRLDDASLKNSIKDWVRKPGDMALFVAGLAATVFELGSDGPSPTGLVGLAIGVAPVGKGLLKLLGFISAEYDGPQWPFLYTFGRAASARKIARLRRALRTIRS
jgi:hypothetical protein